MTRRSKTVRFFDFTGGLNTKSPVTAVKMNEALDLQNINILPSGGFEKRRGNSAFNASAMNGGAAVQGLGYYKTAAGVEYMMAIAGAKVFKADNLDGTMDDVTGAVTITAGKDNIWTYATMNDLAIFVGGAPDAPIKWNATGNFAALGGSPPSGTFGIVGNNRFFIGSGSTIYWSILGNPDDWSGTGSGSTVANGSDGDTLVGAALNGYDHMLLFKQNSVYDLSIRTSPFPIFPLFPRVGAISKRGILNIDGIVYFVTAEPRLKATDGTNVIDFPDTLDTTWDSLNIGRLPYLHMQYNRRLHQIWIYCSSTSATTNDIAIVWDIARKCWLKNPTGFGMNSSALIANRLTYAGAYDGKIYKLDAESTYNDASETTPTINAYWRSGWMDFGDSLLRKSPSYIEAVFTNQTSGNFEVGMGFNFQMDRVLNTITMVAVGGTWDSGVWDTALWGGQTDSSSLFHLNGSGKFLQFLIRNKNASERLLINGISFPVEDEEVVTLR